ncbi:MAG: hypothetical protein AB8F74_10450 [Saprospiraceae bacterium]
MRLLMNLIVLFILPFIMPKSEETISTETYSEYCNVRYDFCVNYPSHILSDKFVSDNDDGVVLSNANNNLTVTVSGSPVVSGKSVSDMYDDIVVKYLEEENGDREIYIIIQEDYFETSFIRGDQMYYQKLKREGGDDIMLEIVGPKGSKYSINDLKEKIELTF